MYTARTLARTIRPLVARASPRIAPLARTAPIRGLVTEGGKYVDIKDIVQDYPDIPERVDPEDVGHSTTGESNVGRHSARTLKSLSMEKKVCVVTGAARGLGNLMARTFVESGANQIAIVDLDEALAKEAAEDINKWFVDHGEADPGEVEAVGIGCDVSDEASVKAVFKEVEKRFGTVDVLVTAAGIVHNFAATEYPTEKLQQLFNININGSFFCAREAAKIMLEKNGEKGGSIILVGSMSGSIVNVPQPQTPYNASKAAVRHMSASLAVEWAKQNIRVNTLSPGYMATSLTRTILDANPELKRSWEGLTPMGRVGEPEDLKGAIVFLASDSSKFVTGIDLRVDGGYTCT